MHGTHIQDACRAYLRDAGTRANMNRAFGTLLPAHMRRAWYGPPYAVLVRSGNEPAHTNEYLDRSHWSSEFGIRLLVGRCTVAALGFLPGQGELRVVQIQGVAGCAKELCDIRWQPLLVSTLIETARGSAYRRISIRPAGQNPFFPDGDAPGYEAVRQRFERHYDDTADALGFTFDEARRLYVFDIRTGS